MSSLKFFFLVSISLFFAVCSNAGDSIAEADSKYFLDSVRRPPHQDTWAKLGGKIIHKRSGTSENLESPLRVALRFTPDRLLARIVIDADEKYSVGQVYSSSAAPEEGTSVITENMKPNGKSTLADCGLRPEDLTLSFIYWKFEKELEPTSFKGRDCRVFLLNSQDGKEKARVSIDTEARFPLKSEWIKIKDAKEEVYRTIEISSFKKESDFWFVESFFIFGPGFRTKVEFSEISAGFAKDGVPQDLFQDSSNEKAINGK